MHSLRAWVTDQEGGGMQIRDGYGVDKTWGETKKKFQSISLWARCGQVLWHLVGAKAPAASNLDLVITHSAAKIDGLTKWVVHHLVPFWWDFKDYQHSRASSTDEEASDTESQLSRHSEDESIEGQQKAKRYNTLESFSESSALRFTSGLSTVVACLTPVIAITVLSQLSGTRELLLCITGFAIVCAVLLIFLTQGITSRTEIFAATAALSAVLAVFISNLAIKIEMPPGSNIPVVNV